MEKVELVEYEDRWEIDIPNAKIIRCIVDHAFSIVTVYEKYSLSLEIECEFTIEDAKGASLLNIEDKSSLLRGLNLINESVNKIVVQKSGLIAVLMASSRLIVTPHEIYEAWQLYGENGFRLICMPGGDIGIWN